MESITAAGGAVFRSGDEDNMLDVLLIYRQGVWDLPKGKLEDGESIAECALREVTEEVGTDIAPKVISHLTETYHEYEQKGKFFAKTTYWFAMKFVGLSPKNFQPEIEEGIEQVKWISISDAKSLMGYKNLFEVLESLEKQFDH